MLTTIAPEPPSVFTFVITEPHSLALSVIKAPSTCATEHCCFKPHPVSAYTSGSKHWANVGNGELMNIGEDIVDNMESGSEYHVNEPEGFKTLKVCLLGVRLV
jgi:hypothetical protein